MSLKVWLPLLGNLENQGASNLQFTQSGTAITIDTNGKIGQCYTRATAKTAGRIASDNTILLNGDLSMCCWAKVTATVGDTANGLVSNHSASNNAGFGINVKQVSTDDYRICCSTGNGSSRTYSTYYGTTNIKNTWHHLALTYNSTTHVFQLWVDGIVEKTQSYTNSAIAGKIFLFDWNLNGTNNNYKPACSLNDVRIYDHCLSAAEVHEISQGLVLHYKLDDITNGIQDSSGYNYNGTVVGNPILNSDTARYSACIAFNGSTDAINCGKKFEIQHAPTMTFCAWIYSNNWNNSTNKYYLSSQEAGGFLLRSLDNNQLRARIHAYTASDLSTTGYIDADYAQSSANIGTSGWHHVAGVYTTSNLKLYIDGILRKTTSATTYGAHFNSSTYLFLGAECAGSSPSTFCNCKLSDVRIYYTALSDADVKQLYEVGAKVDNKGSLHTYELKEEGTTPKIYKKGIVSHNRLRESGLINTASSFSYKPAANANNSTTVGTYIDLSEFANDDQPLTLTLEYDVSWSNFAAGTGGTFGVYLQGARRKKETNTNVWEGDAPLTADGTFTSLITANATGTYHKSRTFTIPATWFNTYCGQNFGIRTNYSNGNGTITISNLKLTIPVNSFKLKSKSIQSNNLIEL